jgi:hypothetical protein
MEGTRSQLHAAGFCGRLMVISWTGARSRAPSLLLPVGPLT